MDELRPRGTPRATRRSPGLRRALILSAGALALLAPSAAALPALTAAPLPKLEAAALPKVEAPTLPKAELPKVEVPSLPKVEVAPTVEKVTGTVEKVTAPVTGAVEKATGPVPGTVEKVTGPVTGGVEKVTTPLEKATTPVEKVKAPVEGVTKQPPTTKQPPNSGGGSAGGAGQASAAGVPRPGQGGAASATPGATFRARAGGHARGAQPSARTAASGTAGAAAANKAATAPAANVPALGAPLRRASHASRGGEDPLSSLGRDIPLPLPVPDWSKPIILLLALLAIAFAARSAIVSRRARRLERQRGALLESVGAMQAALVPAVPRHVGELSVSVAYHPADGPAAGGDFYDVFATDATRTAIIVGDVAGHGQGALKQAALTRFTLRAYLQTGMEPRAAIALAGSVLADESAENFATVILAVYDRSSGRLTYASAGHPPPVAIGIDMPEPLTVCCSPPLGWDVRTGRRQTSLAVPVGRALCFFTDGLVEARTEHGLLGRERVQAMAEVLPAPFDAGVLLDVVREHAAATPDDMVACIVSPQGVSGSGGQVEELEVGTAEVENGQAERFLAAFGASERQLQTTLSSVREMLAERDGAVLRVGLDGKQGRAGAISVRPGLVLPSAEPLPSERLRARGSANTPGPPRHLKAVGPRSPRRSKRVVA